MQPNIESNFEKRPSKGNLRFEGPLKIMVIDGKGEYYKTVWCAIGLGLSNVMVGAVNMASLLYSVKVGDKHAIICTVAYHFFMVEAILSLNYANGWSTPMRHRHRKMVHVFLQICAMTFAIVGSAKKLMVKEALHSAHGITGILTATLSCGNLLLGNCALLEGHPFKLLHMGIGVPTVILSSVSLCLSYFTDSFKSWAEPSVIVVLICFVIFYTAFIVATILIKIASRL